VHGLFLSLQAEADRELDLVAVDLAVGDVAPDLVDLEPGQVPQGFRGCRDRVLDGAIDALARGADERDLLVDRR